MKVIVAAISLVLLAACQSPGTSQSDEDPCGATSHQYLVGTLISDLNKLTLPELSRILHPTTPMTRDYRLDRVNIYVDEGGKVFKVTCG